MRACHPCPAYFPCPRGLTGTLVLLLTTSQMSDESDTILSLTSGVRGVADSPSFLFKRGASLQGACRFAEFLFKRDASLQGIC
jgi:hypothetical protein